MAKATSKKPKFIEFRKALKKEIRRRKIEEKQGMLFNTNEYMQCSVKYK